MKTFSDFPTDLSDLLKYFFPKICRFFRQIFPKGKITKEFFPIFGNFLLFSAISSHLRQFLLKIGNFFQFSSISGNFFRCFIVSVNLTNLFEKYTYTPITDHRISRQTRYPAGFFGQISGLGGYWGC